MVCVGHSLNGSNGVAFIGYESFLVDPILRMVTHSQPHWMGGSFELPIFKWDHPPHRAGGWSCYRKMGEADDSLEQGRPLFCREHHCYANPFRKGFLHEKEKNTRTIHPLFPK